MEKIKKHPWQCYLYVWITLISVLMMACSSITPHQNFVLMMQSKVGKNRYSDTAQHVLVQKLLLGSSNLPNGNIELEFKFIKSCHYFFEINPTDDIIVDWHYMGNDEDCGIPP